MLLQCPLDFITGNNSPLLLSPILCHARRSLCHVLSTATAAGINPYFRVKYLGRSCECYFVNAHVQSDCSPRCWTVSRQNIDDSRWKPSLSKQYRRKQSLVEITTEPSKTASGVGESGPNPRSLPAENRGNIKKKVSKTR